jgi:hypothetical protein
MPDEYWLLQASGNCCKGHFPEELHIAVVELINLKRCTKSSSKLRFYEETMSCRLDTAPEPLSPDATYFVHLPVAEPRLDLASWSLALNVVGAQEGSLHKTPDDSVCKEVWTPRPLTHSVIASTPS